MKHGRLEISALVLLSMAGGPAALALEQAEIVELARSSVQATFLENGCGLVPSPETEARSREEYLQLSESRKIANDPSWDAYTKALDKAAREYASLNIRLSRDAFCERLQADFSSAGGTLIRKE